MNNELKTAVETYCFMLPYPNRGANPNDDGRLYTIAKICYKTNSRLSVNDIVSELKKKTSAEFTSLDDEFISDFAQDRLDEINHAIYIFERAGI